MASTDYGHHPLPAPPSSYQQQNQAPPPLPQYEPYQQHQPRPSQASQVQKQERTRPKSRAFSFRSDKSQKSTNSHPKVDLHETSAEKEAKRLHTHADPRMALNEAEPAARAHESQTLATLRSMQHKDSTGAPISDPDRSNPTRSRWERPLDTIRSFEAAIDGGYSRQSMYKSDADSVANWNRRSSYYGNNGPRFPQDSYYGGRPNSAMFDPRSSAMMGGPRESYHEGFDGPYGPGGQKNRYSRMQSDPQLSGRGPVDRNVYPSPNNHRSYETVASGSGSASYGEPAGYTTDPTSSENSSINRRSPAKRQEPVNDYGISFGQSPSYSAPGLGVGQAPPAVPRKEPTSLQKRPVVNVSSQARPGTGEKRKSWLMRRFSKNN
ncbi:hypothetical protein F4780DRAFT_777162 [Xylariomycetidae sp. FL0641]|nr:hypothetical protein F4780DRAFT_777162 [Xylariomycetidae sp. FL0641]